jgi:AraC-like DNA-binding protein
MVRRHVSHRKPEILAASGNRVGFADAFALSAAFKREHGLGPSEFRAREGMARA